MEFKSLDLDALYESLCYIHDHHESLCHTPPKSLKPGEIRFPDGYTLPKRMKVSNLISVIADDDLIQGALVIHHEGHCRPLMKKDFQFGNIPKALIGCACESVKAGSVVNIATDDTVFVVDD